MSLCSLARTLPSARRHGWLSPVVLLSALSCACAPQGEYQHLPSPETADQIAECNYTVDYNPQDPNDYVWTVKAEAIHTLGILQGSVEVHFRRFAAGEDPETGTPQNSGELKVDSFGSLRRTVELADGISYRDLIDGTFTFHTLRGEDNLAMTSCAKKIKLGDAVKSHNALLANEYPDFTPPAGITDPAVFAQHLSGKPGVVMMVDNDCIIPDIAENPDETRSVLSWLAVTIEARPAPQLVDPFRVQGINFEAKADEGSFCQDSPYDWTWKIKAFSAQTQIGNSNDFPGDKDVNLHVNSGFFSSGLAASNVQVDPLGDLSAEEGIILTDYEGAVVREDILPFIVNEEGGLTFSINRDDWGTDKEYAACTAKLKMHHLEAAVTGSEKLHLIKEKFYDESRDPANFVPVTCTDGYLAKLGLHYLDIGIEMGTRRANHAMPARPDLSTIVAETPLVEMPVEAE